MIRYRCSRCGGLCEVDDSRRGKLNPCPSCGVVVRVAESRAPTGKGINPALANLITVTGGIVSIACIAAVATYKPGPAPQPAPAAPQASREPAKKAKPAEIARVESPKPAAPKTVEIARIETPKPAEITRIDPPKPSTPQVTVIPIPSSPSSPSSPSTPAGNDLFGTKFQGSGDAAGKPLDIGLTGRTWTLRTPGSPLTINNNRLTGQPGRTGGLMVSLKPASGFTPPKAMRVRATLRSGYGSSQNEAFRGAGVGFWSIEPELTSARVGFYGIILNPDGTISLWTGQRSSTTSVRSTFPGQWNAQASHAVEFDVDASSGRMSNVRIDGRSLPLTSTEFTAGKLQYAGVMISNADNVTEGATVEDFSLAPLH